MPTTLATVEPIDGPNLACGDAPLPVGIDFLGLVSLTPLGLEEVVARLAARSAAEPFAFLVTANVQHVVLLDRPGNLLREPYRAAWMCLCDSQIIRLIARTLFGQRLPLATGADLALLLLQRVIRPDDPIAIIGGNEEIVARLQAQFCLRHIVQHVPPLNYFSSLTEVQRCVDFVIMNPARFVFIITGAPRSEQVLLRVLRSGRAKGIGLPVGSALHFATGMVPRAPKLIRLVGLEWLFRLVRSPHLFGYRFIFESLPVLWLAVRAFWRGGARSVRDRAATRQR